MSLSLIPESAPFNVEQRAWLNGFLAGWLGLPGSEAPPAMPSLSVPVAPDEEFPWHDAALALDERLAMAEGKPTERKLMAAMAQLDCGACGYVCQTYAEAIANGAEKRLTLCSPGGTDTTKAIKRLLKEAPAVAAEPSRASIDESAGWSRTNPFPARLIDSRNLNGDGSAKRTHHVEIDLGDAGLAYEAGDALGVYPVNCDGLVESVMETIGASGETTVWTGSGETSFREALLRDCCLTRPGEDLISLLAESTRDESDAKALRALLEDDEPIRGWDVLDLLHHFSSARPSASAFVAALSELSPRLYSISSSPKRHAGQVHLTVGRVAFERGGRVRKGVASTMLSERLSPGDRLRVFVHKSPKFRPPADPAAPVIMVGPGTGVAPFRAFLHDRDAAGATGKNWLFFGDQCRATDFLYEGEFRDLTERGRLTRLDLAFSRDGDRKVYVQDRMAESARELFAWLEEGAYFYVCGDAKRMAVDVERTLAEIVAGQSGRSMAEAKAYVADLARQGRYLKDVY